MKIDKNGITRLVILTKKYAIKIPRLNYGWEKFIAGIYSNISEYKCYTACKGYCDEFLCPVLFSFAGFVLIMPKLSVCKNESEISHIPNDDGIDRKPDNYGYYNNRVVCIDYPYHRINEPFKKYVHEKYEK